MLRIIVNVGNFNYDMLSNHEQYAALLLFDRRRYKIGPPTCRFYQSRTGDDRKNNIHTRYISKIILKVLWK